MEEEPKLNIKLISSCAIFFAIGMILVSGYLIWEEFSGAKESCDELGGEYSFNFPDEHFCDDELLIKYDDGWSYEREFNLSKILYP